ncbi:MAG: hypothetical protein IJ986_09135, partial [Bacteroidales bacterium]|nr:hypothetical protein [Bacteroidales bacterium]
MKKIFLLFVICVLVMALPAQTNIYVSPAGNDSDSGSASAPVRTLSRALMLADTNSTHIFLAAGNYSEIQSVNLVSNVLIDGGYNAASWTKDSTAVTTLTINTIEFIGDYSQKIGLRSDNDTNWTLQDLVISIPSATAAERAPSGKGASVYGLHIAGNSADTRISNCRFDIGNGGDGINGTNGVNGGNGNSGTSGGDGGLSEWTNDGDEEGIGGATVGSGDRRGGAGGNGGEGDINNDQNSSNSTGDNGQNGTRGGVNNSGGAGGAGGHGGTYSHDGSNGANGLAGADGITPVSCNSCTCSSSTAIRSSMDWS